MKVKPGQLVTIAINETGEEVTGYVQSYTPDTIALQIVVKFDAKKVHFKDVKK